MNFQPGSNRKVRGVRYRADSGFEMRCLDCRTYWPLAEEFWPVTRRVLQRCKACEAQRNRRARRTAYRRARAQELARQKAYDDQYRNASHCRVPTQRRRCARCKQFQVASDRPTESYCRFCKAAYMREHRAKEAVA